MKSTLWTTAAALLVSACGPSVYIIAEQDPASIPQKSDPVKLITRDRASIADRQLLPLFAKQLSADGFNVVEDKESATWLLRVSCNVDAAGIDRKTVGSTDSEAGTFEAESKTTITDDSQSLIHLALFDRAALASGRKEAIWAATAAIDPDDMDEFRDVIVMDLIEVYGTNYKDDRRVKFQKRPK